MGHTHQHGVLSYGEVRSEDGFPKRNEIEEVLVETSDDVSLWRCNMTTGP